MIKLVTQVVVGTMLSFGMIVAGINPTIRAEVQAAGAKTAAATVSVFGSANTSLSNFFSGKASVQGSATGSAATPVNTKVSANTNLEMNTLIHAGVQHINSSIQAATRVTVNTQTKVNAKTNGSITFGSGATNAGVGLAGSTNAGLSLTGSNTNAAVNSDTSTSTNAHIGVQAGSVSLNTLLYNQMHAGLGISK